MSRDETLKHDLECLRLASDLAQLSQAVKNPDLKAYYERMAAYWSGQADAEPNPAPRDGDPVAAD